MIDQIQTQIKQMDNVQFAHFCNQLKNLLNDETTTRYTVAEHELYLVRSAALFVDLLPSFPASTVQPDRTGTSNPSQPGGS